MGEVAGGEVLAREAVEPGSEALRQIVDRFGPEVLLDDGQLDRNRLGEIVFDDAEARKRIQRLQAVTRFTRQAIDLSQHHIRGEAIGLVNHLVM